MTRQESEKNTVNLNHRIVCTKLGPKGKLLKNQLFKLFFSEFKNMYKVIYVC